MCNQSIEGAVQFGVLLLLVLLLLALYLLAKGTQTVGTTYAQHPGHKGLIAAGLVTLLAALGATLTAGSSALVAVAAASALMLCFIARVVQVREDTMLQGGWSIDDVLHPASWWEAA